VTQHHVEPALGFPRKHGDTHVPACVEIDCAPVQHRQASRYVEASHGNANPGGPEWPRNVERAWILVRLYADKRHTSEIAVAPEAGKQRGYVNTRVRFVDHFDFDGDVRPEDLPRRAIGRNAINGGEGAGLIVRHQRITYPSLS
jgi:hypothetical protein